MYFTHTYTSIRYEQRIPDRSDFVGGSFVTNVYGTDTMYSGRDGRVRRRENERKIASFEIITNRYSTRRHKFAIK